MLHRALFPLNPTTKAWPAFHGETNHIAEYFLCSLGDILALSLMLIQNPPIEPVRLREFIKYTTNLTALHENHILSRTLELDMMMWNNAMWTGQPFQNQLIIISWIQVFEQPWSRRDVYGYKNEKILR